MTFVPGFSSDIFISYTHLDNEPDAQNEQWVGQFRDFFASALRKRLGRDDVTVFFDRSDLGAQELAYLLENARSAALFMPVLSRAYVERPWTIAELNAFHETSRQRHAALAGINRIVPIEILPFEENAKVASLLAGSRGMGVKRTRFYFQDPESKIDYTLTPSHSDAYWKRVAELAENCVRLLRELKAKADVGEAAQQPAMATVAPASVASTMAASAMAASATIAPAILAPAVLAPGSAPSTQLPLRGKTILLAQSTDDLYDEAQQVGNYLGQFGATVVPHDDYPVGGADFAKAVRADLERADLFVQLLSGSRSRIPSDLRQSENEPAQSYSAFQYEAARRRAVPLPILQWRRPDINPEAVTHSDRQLLMGPDVRVMGLQEFMSSILTKIKDEDDKLRRSEERRRKAEEHQAADGGAACDESFFFINAYPDDLELANTLAAAFKKNRRNAFLPLTTGLAKEKDEDVDENLINCDGLLLVFGMAPAHWVRAQLRRYFKLAPRREKAPVCRRIVIAPGAEPDAVAGATNFEAIDCREGALDDLIHKVVGDLCPI